MKKIWILISCAMLILEIPNAVAALKVHADAYEAEIIGEAGTIAYSSLSEAIQAWEDGQTLRLCSDATVSTIRLDGVKKLDLNGHTLRGDGSGSVIEVRGTLTVGGGTISGGNSLYGGGIFVSGGKLIFTDGKISENTAQKRGGGIALVNGASLEMSGGVVDSNIADYGGGIYVEKSSAVLSGNSAVRNNVSSWNGGGIYLYGYRSGAAVELKDRVKIEQNRAEEYGGGISLWSCAKVSMEDSVLISQNSAVLGGGAVYVHGLLDSENESKFIMKSGEIVNNSSREGCGAIEVVYGGILEASGGTITNNRGNIGGVYIYEKGSASFGGKLKITQNAGNEGKDSNVYLLSDRIITFESGFTGEIGLGMEREGVVTEFCENVTGIRSDSSEMELSIRDGMLYFQAKAPLDSAVPVSTEERGRSGEIAISIMISLAAATAMIILFAGYLTDKKRKVY